MADVLVLQIDCVNKADRPNPHERILFVGGPNASGVGRYKLSQQDAIAGIEARKWKFWVALQGRKSVWVIVAVSRFGNKYLRTEADNEDSNNLLSLDECD